MKYIIIAALLLLLAGVYVGYRSPTPQISQQASTTAGTLPGVSDATVLDLSGQGLTKVPDSVFTRTDLTKLDLSHNALSGSLQAEVRHLQGLRELDLNDNHFTGVPAEVGQLKELEVLDLSNNSLTGLPHEIGNLSNLKLLDLRGNNYSEADLSIIRKNLPSSTVIKTD